MSKSNVKHVKTSPSRLVDKRDVIGKLFATEKIYQNHIDIVEIAYNANFNNRSYYSPSSGWRSGLAEINRYQFVDKFTNNDPTYHYSIPEMGLYTRQRYR